MRQALLAVTCNAILEGAPGKGMVEPAVIDPLTSTLYYLTENEALRKVLIPNSMTCQEFVFTIQKYPVSNRKIRQYELMVNRTTPRNIAANG
jgi:hypothetical protein